MKNIRKIFCLVLALLIFQPILSVKGLSIQVVNPEVPTVILSRSGATSLMLQWDEVYGADGYEVYSSLNGTDYSLLSTQNNLNYVHSPLTEGVTYFYKVRAFIMEGSTKVYSSYSYVNIKFGNTLNLTLQSDIVSLDYVLNYSSTDKMHSMNLIDGLIESDPYGNYVPSMAYEATHNIDSTIWTFKLRQGVNWVTNTGAVYGEVTAQDFVTGLQHAADFQSQTIYIVSDLIQNLEDYPYNNSDFSQVGIKAVDKYTVQYTLSRPTPWFDSLLAQPVLYPINKTFLESKGVGCKLGLPDSTLCEYGTSLPNSILYNGPFLLTRAEPDLVVTYDANPNYWDKNHVYLTQINHVSTRWLSSDLDLGRFEKGFLSQIDLDSSNYDSATLDHPGEVVIPLGSNITYDITFNLARNNVTHTLKNADQLQDTKIALLNKNFRLALLFGLDRESMVELSSGIPGVAKLNVRNTLVPPHGFISNQKDYGTLLSEQLELFDGTSLANLNLSDGQDAYYDPSKAAFFLEKAKQELGNSVTWPIRLDLPCMASSIINTSRSAILKSSLESSLGGSNIQVDLWELPTSEYYNTFIYVYSGAEVDFDISPIHGWGPDYSDPKSWLNIYNPNNGDMLQMLGLNNGSNKTPEMEQAIISSGLAEYKTLIDAANAEISDLEKRYQLYAKADAFLIANALCVPLLTNGRTPRLTRVIPFTSPFSIIENGNSRFKYTQVQLEPVTSTQYAVAKETWDSIRTNTGIYAPMNFKAASSSYNSVKLSWDKVATATGYEVYRGFNETGSFAKIATVNGTTLNYVNASLTTNRSYFYKIRAYSTVDGVTTYSNFSSVVSAKPIPAAPASIDVVAVNSSSMNITWAAVEGATGYQLFRSFGPTGTFTLAASTTTNSYLNTGLTLNRTYFYRVRAYTMVGTTRVVGPYSTIDSAKPIPAAPINVIAASGGYDRINLSWTPAIGAGGYTIYRATSLTGSYSIVGNVTTNSFQNVGLGFNTTYYYKVRSFYMINDVKNYGLMSEPISAKTALSTPTVSSSNLSTTSIKLTWGAISGASGYEVYRSTTSNGTYALQGTVTTNTYSKTGLVKGTVYYYKVRAYRLVGSTKVYGNFSTPKYLKVGY